MKEEDEGKVKNAILKRLNVHTNRFGVKVRMACMSCTYHDYDKDCKPVCKRNGIEETERYYCCRHWKISEGLKNAGSGKGRLRFNHKPRIPESLTQKYKTQQ